MYLGRIPGRGAASCGLIFGVTAPPHGPQSQTVQKWGWDFKSGVGFGGKHPSGAAAALFTSSSRARWGFSLLVTALF